MWTTGTTLNSNFMAHRIEHNRTKRRWHCTLVLRVFSVPNSIPGARDPGQSYTHFLRTPPWPAVEFFRYTHTEIAQVSLKLWIDFWQTFHNCNFDKETHNTQKFVPLNIESIIFYTQWNSYRKSVTQKLLLCPQKIEVTALMRILVYYLCIGFKFSINKLTDLLRSVWSRKVNEKVNCNS